MLIAVLTPTRTFCFAEIGTCAAAVSAVSIVLKSIPVKLENEIPVLLAIQKSPPNYAFLMPLNGVSSTRQPARRSYPPRRLPHKPVGLLEQRQELLRSLVGLLEDLHTSLL